MPNSIAAAIILFDADCPMCRSLAEIAARRSGDKLAFRSWQDFQGSDAARQALPAEVLDRPADSLRVLVGTEIIEGEAAWTYLLDQHPDLQSLGWMAQRLGFNSAAAAKVVHHASDLLRRLCWHCPDARRPRPSRAS